MVDLYALLAGLPRSDDGILWRLPAVRQTDHSLGGATRKADDAGDAATTGNREAPRTSACGRGREALSHEPIPSRIISRAVLLESVTARPGSGVVCGDGRFLVSGRVPTVWSARAIRRPADRGSAPTREALSHIQWHEPCSSLSEVVNVSFRE
jgi:hypothetical protein